MDRPTFSFTGLGTTWEIETDQPLADWLGERILDRVRSFDATYSRFRPDSLVTQVAGAAGGGRFAFPTDAIALFDLYDRLHAATDGAVDPLIGRQLERLGYDAAYSLTPVPEAVDGWLDRRPRWMVDVQRAGSTLVTHRPLVIDLGAVGKGYLVDELAGILEAAEAGPFVIDGSGDLRHAGPQGVRVGLEHPLDPTRVIGVANLRNGALCASATNRRAWGDGLHHVLDARTGAPTYDVIATWVLADTAALADGVATALFFVEADRLAETFAFAFVRMHADGTAEMSRGFDGELFD